MHDPNGNTFSFIPHVCYFSYYLSIASSEAWSLKALFSTKMRGEETQSQEHHPCSILLEFHRSSLPFCKNHKNLMSSIQDTYIDWELCLFLKTVIILCINCELVRKFYSLGLLLNLSCKQYIIIVCLWSHSFDKQGCDFTYDFFIT